MSNSTQLTARAQEMFARIEKYLAAKAQGDGRSQKVFCEQEGLAVTTFQNWLQKYRARQRHAAKALAPANGFIPLQVREPQSTVSPRSCVIEFPNGVILRWSGSVDLQPLAHLIAGW